MDKHSTSLDVDLASVRDEYQMKRFIGRCLKIFRPDIVQVDDEKLLKLTCAPMMATKSFQPEVKEEEVEELGMEHANKLQSCVGTRCANLKEDQTIAVPELLVKVVQQSELKKSKNERAYVATFIKDRDGNETQFYRKYLLFLSPKNVYAVMFFVKFYCEV